MSHHIGVFKRHQLDTEVVPDKWVVLSLTQPWASALFLPGIKTIETRGWKTLYRGRLYIHASKGFPKWAREFAQFEQVEHGIQFDNLPFGAIIGHVDLIDIKPTAELRQNISATESRFGDYSARRFGWITENPQLLPEPIPALGQLGLWQYGAQGAARRDEGVSGEKQSFRP